MSESRAGPVRKPRVLMVGPFPPPIGGGVATFMLNVEGSALSDRYEYVRFTTSRPEKQNVSANTGYAALLNAGVGRMLRGAAVTLWHLVKFPFRVVFGRIDLVQVQASVYMTFWESACYVALARALGRPTLMRIGGATDVFYEVSSARGRRGIERVLGWPDGLIVQSEYWRSFVADRGRREGVFVVHNFVGDAWVGGVGAGNAGVGDAGEPGRAPEQVGAEARAQALGIPLFLFSAGTEAVRKGLPEVLEAITRIKQAGVSVRFRIIAASASVVEEIDRRELGDLVEVRGFVPRSEMRAQYLDCDAFLLPTRGEGFPNALLEAMACGLAVIATPVGAIPEVVEEGHNGLLVPVGDVDALTRAIVALVEAPTARRDMGRRNRDLVADAYSAGTVLPMLEEAYLAVLERRSKS